MTPRDYANLAFLLTASEQELRDWYGSATDDDITYASSLLTVGSAEMIDHVVDTMFVYPAAASYLRKFRLQSGKEMRDE